MDDGNVQVASASQLDFFNGKHLKEAINSYLDVSCQLNGNTILPVWDETHISFHYIAMSIAAALCYRCHGLPFFGAALSRLMIYGMYYSSGQLQNLVVHTISIHHSLPTILASNLSS